MKIVFVSAEVVPYSKTGGLGDVSSAIPKAMEQLGHNVSIFTPLYKSIDVEKHNIKLVKKDLLAPVGDKVEVVFDLYETTHPDSEIPVYFIKNTYLYRDGIYVGEDGEDYPDSPIRFISFIKSIFIALEQLEAPIDIFHVNDWHSGLLPFFLKTEYGEHNLFKTSKSVFTIHNIGYQGVYGLETIEDANIPEIYLNDDLLGFHGLINFMKAGIVYTDVLTTVSSKYAEEIQTKQFGYGLEKIIETRKDDLYGIVHGIDLTVWNPKTDELIPKNYDSRNLKGKEECKNYLQDKLNLDVSDKPLVGIITRLATQKGLDLILKKFNKIMNLGVQFVLLGTGDPKLEKSFKAKEKKYPQDCSINIEFDNRLAHQIEAGSDFFLMPSRYEPCGLNQLYSMLYGSVPIVRKTGGLSDTVQDYNEETGEGSGFVFERINADRMFEAIERGVNLYKQDKGKFTKLQKHIMNKDFSWNNAAKQWQKVYLKAKIRKIKKTL
ncbi:MAG: glycogen synthase GlgA [Candidatus Heimdallarchaeota archaeon]|nr:glycogen synthase GlgA [Candidatus Heimdallarchaeota archaeon]MCK5142529.1 glycogen synthase GlgA [Candidatus Heimdallarchaeota archaeon]